MSRFHVPQGRSKIAQRFIAGVWRKHETSPVRDERTHRSSPIFSVAPPAFAARQSADSARRRPGLWSFSTRNPRLKPVETVGYLRSSLSGLWDPCSSAKNRDWPPAQDCATNSRRGSQASCHKTPPRISLQRGCFKRADHLARWNQRLRENERFERPQLALGPFIGGPLHRRI